VRGWGAGPSRRSPSPVAAIRPPNPRSFDAAASTSYARQASDDSHSNWPAVRRRSRPVQPWDAGRVVVPWAAGPLFHRGGASSVGRSQISTRSEENVRRDGERRTHEFGGKYISRGGKRKRTRTREHCSLGSSGFASHSKPSPHSQLSRSPNRPRQRVQGMPGLGDGERKYKSPFNGVKILGTRPRRSASGRPVSGRSAAAPVSSDGRRLRDVGIPVVPRGR
jgi:hypothetical protein